MDDKMSLANLGWPAKRERTLAALADWVNQTIDPNELAALRTQRSVGKRSEGKATAALSSIGDAIYNAAAGPSRLVNAHIGEYQPGVSVANMPQTMEQLPEVAMNVTGAPGVMGGVPAGAIGSAAAKFVPVRGAVNSEQGYVYHATNSERAREIAASKLAVHKPHEFTDQSLWPDGSTQKRNYFTPTAGNSWQFAPEGGTPVLLRMKQDAHPIAKEHGTGDLYSTKPVSPDKLEAYTNEGWIPLTNNGHLIRDDGK